MTERDDHALLREYVKSGSEPAFAALVERHLNLVHAAALRRTGNPHAAGEIAQAVFIILARKAGKLNRKTILSGWLYQTAQLTAANYLRGEIRRQRREQEAYVQSILNEPSDDWAWRQIAPQLEEAMAKLGDRDRNAIVLRYFENKSLAEVGAALGASEDAAKMRVNRALEKLKKIFNRRGVTLTTVIIAGAVSANSVHAAPAALAKTISAVAVAKGAAAGTSTLTLVKGALKLMAWTKAKTTIVTAAVVVLAAGSTTVTLEKIHQHNLDNQWDFGRVDSRILHTAPHIVRIIPTKFHEGGWAVTDYGILGIAADIHEIVLAAYGGSYARTMFLSPAPPGKYDFISNLMTGSKEALQQQIRKRFGLVGRFTTVETNVLFLRVIRSGAAGLVPSRTHGGSSSFHGNGEFTITNLTSASIANYCESDCRVPVIDQTGLKGKYDVDLKWHYKNDPQHKNLRQALIQHLGLKLVPGMAPVRMLVVSKVQN